jgi:peptidoglycan/xylan/chitin deacetylase (PgdA/CDA1 family)
MSKWLGLSTIALIAILSYFLIWDGVYVFEGVRGPQKSTALAPALPARWQDYEQGGTGRLALLLTNPDSAWLGLVHGLQSIGVPFLITRDYREAVRHHVVIVYPTVSGRVLPAEALQALAKFPAEGGTLIGINVEGGGLNEIFGFKEAHSARIRHEIVFDLVNPLASSFDDPREHFIPFSNPKSGVDAAGSLGYSGTKAPLASFDDDTTAITAHNVGKGHAYAFGIDPGFLLLTGYNNREQGVARSYVNDYEPALDVLLRLLRNIYREGEPLAVTLDTVPQGKTLATLITHDVDYGPSLTNATVYAEYEAKAGIHATYFIQTKYVRDWNDDVFFNVDGLVPLRHLRELGMEIASHSVSHSTVFNQLPIGSGEESYPQYRPFVRDKEHTEKATVLGELRVSRFLLEHFLPDYRVVSFRPGHLKNPYSLPQALEATGYRFSSSVTANNSLTHLPFRLTYGRETKSSSAIYEFPVTIEDEAMPPLGDRLPQALDLAGRLARYGGLLVVLIHTEVTDHKLDFERRFVEALRQRAWFGTLREFGEFWTARDRIKLDVKRQGMQLRVTIVAPERIAGLTLHMPSGYLVTSVEPRELKFTQNAGHVVIDELSADATLILEDTKSVR